MWTWLQGDGLNAVYRVGVAGEHRALLNEHSVHKLLHFFLEIDGKDPMYDPVLDFVVVPSSSVEEEEIEVTAAVKVTSS